jgi:PAS domain S-box-containing protein
VKEDKVIGVRGVCVDIRKLKEAEEVLKRSRDELERLVAERTADLESSNKQLRKEIVEKIQAQESLAQSEGRFRAIFEKTPDCIFIKDLSLRYTMVNPSMENLMELPGSAIVGKTDRHLFGAEAAGHLESTDIRVLGGEVVEEEHSLKVKGAELTFLDVKAPLTDMYGQVVGLCGISRDITERRALETVGLPSDLPSESRAMRGVLAAAHLAAENDSTVLLTGESGSGKDYLARYIHNHSRRSSGPFYSINCASIPAELAESELFGHEAGAFTGATKRKRGLLELAEGGTILLNEIGELSQGLQAKLLAFLDTRTFTRVGGEKDVAVNVRLIAATNRNLREEISAGRFRQDLFYRLDVFSIRLPPLRGRLDDLPRLVNEFIERLAPSLGYTGGVLLDPRVMDTLRQYAWPGNVRELLCTAK